jgi:hypothetical protein
MAPLARLRGRPERHVNTPNIPGLFPGLNDANFGFLLCFERFLFTAATLAEPKNLKQFKGLMGRKQA